MVRPGLRDLLPELGASHSLLDVFHAVGYLDTLLEALGYTADQRLEQRQRWLRGEVDGTCYLHNLQAHYNLTEACLQTLAPEAQTAWHYLHKHAQQAALAILSSKLKAGLLARGKLKATTSGLS